MAVTIDGVKENEMPTSPIGKNGQYYKVDVSCGSSKTSGLWDYNAWRLNLDYIESNSKCNLTFTSTMSKEQYDEYIKSGVALRRNTYRGKDITELWKSGELYTQISNGTFADIYVGDYILSNRTATADGQSRPIVWLIADLDNYWNIGTTPLTKHHATIISAGSLMDVTMNSTRTTKGGYVGSDMYKATLPKILSTYIEPDFTKNNVSHVLEYQTMLVSEVNESLSNQYGANSGASSAWAWLSRKLDLMSEVNVFGTTAASSSFMDVGIDNKQYAIFQLKPELINQDLNGNRIWVWLKGVVDKEAFCVSTGDGLLSRELANNLGAVRPRFLIG